MACRHLFCITLLAACALPAMAQNVHDSNFTELVNKSSRLATFNSMTDSQKKLTASTGMNAGFLETNIDRAMKDAISDGETPGGVVLVWRKHFDGSGDEPAFFKAYGDRAIEPTIEATTTDTIYDMASLTKSIATASSIMKLVQQGRIRLTDSVKKFIPEWKNSKEEDSNAALLNHLEKAIDQGKLTRDSDRWKSADDETGDLLSKATKVFPELQSAPVTKDFNFLPRDRESITIRHLLTHTSGLPSYVRFYERYPERGARKQIVGDIAKIKLIGPIGGQFVYSDLGFITLGDIVERVSGMPLDEFSKKNVFEPLHMDDTMFNPPDSLTSRIAPTEYRMVKNPKDGTTTRALIRGDVHDGNAWVQNGVSGHAGLFSTAKDLSRYCRMMLNGGTLDSATIFSPTTVKAITTNHARLPDGEAERGLGWDVSSGYSSQRGDLFDSGFGHTGFTGTSIWVIPNEKLAIIILTNHVHPNGKGTVVPLRARIANIVAGSLTKSYQDEQSEKTND